MKEPSKNGLGRVFASRPRALGRLVSKDALQAICLPLEVGSAWGRSGC